MKNRLINVKGADIAVATRHEQDYISLTRLDFTPKPDATAAPTRTKISRWRQQRQGRAAHL